MFNTEKKVIQMVFATSMTILCIHFYIDVILSVCYETLFLPQNKKKYKKAIATFFLQL